MSNIIEMEKESNPWSNDIEHFLQYCCPECETRCHLKEKFLLHAMEHPKYIDSLKKAILEEEPFDDLKELNSPKYNSKSDHQDKPSIPKIFELNIENNCIQAEVTAKKINDAIAKIEQKENIHEQTQGLKMNVDFQNYGLSNENVNYFISNDDDHHNCEEEEIITENLSSNELSHFAENTTTIDSEIEIKSENIEINNDIVENTTIGSGGIEIIKSEQIEINHDQIDPLELLPSTNNDVDGVKSTENYQSTENKLDDSPVTEVPKLYRYRCGICGLNYENSLNLGWHIEEEHEEDNIKSTENSQMIKFETKLDDSPTEKDSTFEEIKVQKYQWKCDICGKCFYSSEKLEKHDSSHDFHVPRQILNKLDGKTCTECGLTGRKRFDTIRHIRNVHLKIKLYECNICNYGNERMKILQMHYKTSHLYLDKMSAGLERHSDNNVKSTENSEIIKFETESDDIPLVNEVKNSLDLERHGSEEHVEDTNIKSTTNSEIVTFAEINADPQVSTEVQKYQCNLCGKCFDGSLELEKHDNCYEELLSQSSCQYQCKCGICNKYFEDSLDLERHVGKEHSDKEDHLPKPIDQNSMPNNKNLGKESAKNRQIGELATAKSQSKTKRCGTCQGCTNKDCRKCGPCLQMKKYGGSGKLKQACIYRKCSNPIGPGGKVIIERGNSKPKIIESKKVEHNDVDFQGNSKSQSVITVRSIESNERPKLSYSGMIAMAIRNLPDQKATLQEIYDWIMSAFPYYASVENQKGWQNSIRHNLSLNKAFYRTKQQAARLGGGVWKIDPKYLEGKLLKKIRKILP